MNRKLSIIELAELVAAKAQTTNRMSELFLKELFATVSQELTEGRGVEIKGLGSFVMPTAMTDDDEAVIEFAPAQSVADAVNQPFAQFEPMELSDDLRNNVRDGNATAWRLESSLREFPNIKPVNFWFEYPLHRLDTGGTLGAMPAQGTPKAAKVNSAKTKSPESAADEFRTAYNALNVDGKVTVSDMAEYMDVIDKTIYARIRKMGGEFVLEKGVIRRLEQTEN